MRNSPYNTDAHEHARPRGAVAAAALAFKLYDPSGGFILGKKGPMMLLQSSGKRS